MLSERKKDQGLVIVRTTVQNETTNIRKMVTTDRVLSEYLGHKKHKKEEEQEQELSWKTRYRMASPCTLQHQTYLKMI